MKHPRTPGELPESQSIEKVEHRIAQEAGISIPESEKLAEVIFQKIVLNSHAMGPYDYYMGLKELDVSKVSDYERELYDMMKNPRYCLFFELMLVARYKNSRSSAAEARAHFLQREADRTREKIEGAKVIPIRRAIRRRAAKTIKIAHQS